MSDNVMVQFVGFQSKAQVREYTFTVRERETEPREFTVAIANEAFDSRRVRFQDAPDICSHKLHRELGRHGKPSGEKPLPAERRGTRGIPHDTHAKTPEIPLRTQSKSRILAPKRWNRFGRRKRARPPSGNPFNTYANIG